MSETKDNGSVIRKAASDAAGVITDALSMISARDTMIQKQASEIASLKADREEMLKKASEPSINVDKDLLRKTASAVYACSGEPGKVSVDLIENVWKKNPNAILTTLHKIASAQLASMVSGVKIGQLQENTVQKKASATVEESNEYTSARDIWLKK